MVEVAVNTVQLSVTLKLQVFSLDDANASGLSSLKFRWILCRFVASPHNL